MSLPTILTLCRIPLLFIIAALLLTLPATFPGQMTLAFVLFIAAAISDGLDGYYARKLNQITTFGKFMDAISDKILMTGLMVVFLHTGLLPGWMIFFILIILAREFFVSGLRMIAASENVVLAAEQAGKQKTAVQMIAFALLLLSLVVVHDGSRLTTASIDGLAFWSLLFGQTLFALSALLTITSGVAYLLNNKTVLKGTSKSNPI